VDRERKEKEKMKKVCKKCKRIYENVEICQECNEKLSESFKGTIIVMDPENSEIAKKLGINKPGKYAIIVR